ncbi:MAG: hypothetical protein SPH82_06005 [Eubacteriales bacterium]|nr:hypothetical protein [Eubacteriales bacterium]
MKKFAALIALLICIALLATGCGGKEASSAEVTKLSFADSASLDILKSLDGKRVTITGYMATLSPLDGTYIYLMNLPYQSCPFCVPNTTQLANTMAVYAPSGSKFEFTDRPVQVTGTLRVQDRVDDYGYSYNYYIDDASYVAVDLSSVSQEYALYQSLAEDGVIADVNAMFDYLMFICQWTEYMGSYTDESGAEISYYLYPGDVENILADESAYGYAAEASPDYFPGLIRRVEAVSATGLTELTDIIAGAQEVEQYARAELSAGSYTYDEVADKYTLENNDELYNRFYAVYLEFSDWLTRYEL